MGGRALCGSSAAAAEISAVLVFEADEVSEEKGGSTVIAGMEAGLRLASFIFEEASGL